LTELGLWELQNPSKATRGKGSQEYNTLNRELEGYQSKVERGGKNYNEGWVGGGGDFKGILGDSKSGLGY